MQMISQVPSTNFAIQRVFHLTAASAEEERRETSQFNAMVVSNKEGIVHLFSSCHNVILSILFSAFLSAYFSVFYTCTVFILARFFKIIAWVFTA